MSNGKILGLELRYRLRLRVLRWRSIPQRPARRRRKQQQPKNQTGHGGQLYIFGGSKRRGSPSSAGRAVVSNSRKSPIWPGHDGDDQNDGPEVKGRLKRSPSAVRAQRFGCMFRHRCIESPWEQPAMLDWLGRVSSLLLLPLTTPSPNAERNRKTTSAKVVFLIRFGAAIAVSRIF